MEEQGVRLALLNATAAPSQPAFRNDAVSTGSRLEPLSLSFLLAVKAGKIVSPLVSAGMNDPLVHGCSWFVRNGN